MHGWCSRIHAAWMARATLLPAEKVQLTSNNHSAWLDQILTEDWWEETAFGLDWKVVQAGKKYSRPSSKWNYFQFLFQIKKNCTSNFFFFFCTKASVSASLLLRYWNTELLLTSKVGSKQELESIPSLRRAWREWLGRGRVVVRTLSCEDTPRNTHKIESSESILWYLNAIFTRKFHFCKSDTYWYGQLIQHHLI